MKRYIIMISITLVLLLIILFYNPNKKYLLVFTDTMTIKYDFDTIEDYNWSYKSSNDNIILSKKSTLKKVDTNVNYYWVFKPNKNGKNKVTFYYSNGTEIKYEIVYEFLIDGNNIKWVSGYAKGLDSYPNPY